jgi:cytochrome c556
MARKVLIAATVAAVVGFVQIEASGHTGATGVVKERMELMKSIGDATKAIAEMMKGAVAYDAAKVEDLAMTIERHAGEAMTEKFPKDSLDHPSEALPAIWSDWDRFSELSDQLAAYAGALQKAADNPRPIAGSSSMMQRGNMMTQGSGMMAQGGGMMMGGNGPSADHLATMPPDAAFMHVTQTCSACHQDFRAKK